MAIEKMLLVNVLGKLDTMDTALERVCIDEDFHPESTLTFLEDSKGYASISQDNPYTPMLQALDELSKSHAPPLKLTPVTSPVNYDREGLGQFVDHVSDEFRTLEPTVSRPQGRHFHGGNLHRTAVPLYRAQRPARRGVLL